MIQRTTYDKINLAEWNDNKKFLRKLVKQNKNFGVDSTHIERFKALLVMIEAVELNKKKYGQDFLQGEYLHADYLFSFTINQLAEGADATPSNSHIFYQALRGWILGWSMDRGSERGWNIPCAEFRYTGNQGLFDFVAFSPYAVAKLVEYELGNFLLSNPPARKTDIHKQYYDEALYFWLKQKNFLKADYPLPDNNPIIAADFAEWLKSTNTADEDAITIRETVTTTDADKKISLQTPPQAQNKPMKLESMQLIPHKFYHIRRQESMQLISDSTLETLRGISPDELVVHGVISEAPNHNGRKGYCCPLCGSGTGQNHYNSTGDGAGEFDERNKFFCHACGNENVGHHKLSTIDLFAVSRNLQHENFREQCQQMASEFGISIGYEEKNFSRRQSSRKINIEIKPPISDAELDLIREDLFETPDSRLQTFIEKECGGSWRGFTADFLIKYKCKYISEWKSPQKRIENKYMTPTPRVLIPAGTDSYLARFAGKIDIYSGTTRKFVEDTQKMHAGTKCLFNATALNSDEPIFCVEGYIDAMSIELADYKAVALGSCNRWGLLVNAVTAMEKKPHVVILLDSDEKGRETAPKLYDALIDIGCPCVIRFLSDEESKIDCNEILTTQGLDALRGQLENLFDNSLAELDAVEDKIANAEISTTQPEPMDDDNKNKNSNSFSFTNEEREFYLSGFATDLQNARRIEKFCGSEIRWLTDDERWLIYGDGVWRRYSDKAASLLPFVNNFADTLLANAKKLTGDEKKKAYSIAFQFQKRDKISAAVTMLKGCSSILITADDLDKHTNLLNCLNGVVDLQTGKLYQQDSKYLITQQCRAAYDPNAKSELVDKFFRDIMPDEETRNGLLRWLGYCLSGEVDEEKFMVWHGGGKNGKGVLSATILELLGSYGIGLAPTALLKSSRPFDADKPTTALNGIELARFAISEEMPADGELDISLTKNLTGGDRINLRRLHAEYRTVKPTVKLNLSGNYLPKLENIRDEGLLRRILNMPFQVKFGTAEHPADNSLKKKMLLSENLNAFLSLLVAESIKRYRDGLIISPLMEQETKRHLEQNDFIASFIDDYYQRGVNLSVKAKDFIDKLKTEYPRECARFKRADLIKLVAETDGITYTLDRTKTRVFKGIGKEGAPTQQSIDFNDKQEKEELPFDPNDLPI